MSRKKLDDTLVGFSIPKKLDPAVPALQPEARIRTLLSQTPTIHKQIPLWESKWSTQTLQDKLADLGQREFDRSYRQYPISEQDLLWKREWIDNALDRSVSLPVKVMPNDFWGKMRRFGGMDLAIGTAENEAAFFCLSIVGFTKDGMRWIAGINHHRGITLNTQFQILAQAYVDIGWEVCGVENNGIQAAIEGFVRETMTIPTRPIHTGSLQKTDTIVGVPSLATEFEQGRWRIPYGDRRTKNLVDPLLEELYAYPSPGTFFDTIMALYFATRMYRDSSKGTASIISITY